MAQTQSRTWLATVTGIAGIAGSAGSLLAADGHLPPAGPPWPNTCA